MSIRDKIESHPILYVVSIALSAFGAGIGAYQGILGIAQLDVVPKSEIERLRSAVGSSDLQQLRNSIAEKNATVNRLRADVDALTRQLDESAKQNQDCQRKSRTQGEKTKELQDRLALTESNLLQKQKNYSECVEKLELAIKASQRSVSAALSAAGNKLVSSSKKDSDIRRPFFDSNVLRVEVISFEESGPNYHLLLKHTNKTNQPLLIRAFEHRVDTFLHNEDGTQFSHVTIYAAGRSNELELSDRGQNVELAPGGSKVLSFSFARAGASKNGMFSYSSKYGYCLNTSRMSCLPHTPLFVTIKDMYLD